jgi:SAM-dependent methyltransferase
MIAPKIAPDPTYHYLRLDPLPSEQEILDFYRNEYFDLIEAGGRAPELRRAMQGGEEAKRELEWLENNLWTDIREHAIKLSGKAELSLLDFGCGLGDFAEYWSRTTGKAEGIEPSKEAADLSRKRGLQVHDSLQELQSSPGRSYDVITLLNVVEHLANPAAILTQLKSLLSKDGLLVIRVPNDFSTIQEAAQRKLNCEPWWICTPDHLNYFNFASLKRFLQLLEFQVVEEIGEFPMEAFLLFGEVYVGNPQVGAACHSKRRFFESALPAEVRQKLYQALGNAGFGRNCLTFARV